MNGNPLPGPLDSLVSDRARGPRGFTLAELLIAITIAGLLLAIGAPASVNLYRNMQYHSAVSDVMTTLSGARIAAVQAGTSADVQVNPRERSLKSGEEVVYIPDSIDIEVLAARELNFNDTGVIRFYPDGSSSGGVVALSSSAGKSSEVQVDWLLGRVSLCSGDCGSFD